MDRPRRAIRQPVKAPQLVGPTPAPRVIKRKIAAEVDPDKLFKTLLESSKSELVSLDMNDIINNNTWSILSEDSKALLKTLLPPTAFENYRETLGTDHPSLENTMVLDEEDKKEAKELDVKSSFFNDPHLLAAARTFQDHLYLNWFSEAHVQKVKQYQAGIIDGTLAAPWKDQIWERDNPIPEPIKPTSSFSAPCSSAILAGGASQVKLYVLAKNNIIRVGDVIAYKRVFTTVDIVVEKDSIVQSIHPKTYSITLLTPRGTTKDLPANLLSDELPDTPELPDSTLSMTITSPTMLETVILDTDGRVDKARRPNGNAWKTFTVWRRRPGGEHNPYDSRGGRENHGTWFYLRGSFYHESWGK